MNTDQLKALLGKAVAAEYQDDDLESEKDPECRQHLLRDLNQRLETWGVNYQAQARDLDHPAQLAAFVAESPAAAELLRARPKRVEAWAADPARPDTLAAVLLDQFRVAERD